MRLPTNYTPPKSGSRYFKLRSGETARIRLISAEPMIGNEVWIDGDDGSRKVIRIQDGQVFPPEGQGPIPKHFWSVAIWNYETQSVEIWHITQAGIRQTLTGLIDDPDWGDTKDYDLKVTRSGDGLDTKWSVVPCPKSALPAEAQEVITNTKVNLWAILANEDPFSSDYRPTGLPETTTTENDDDEIGF